VVGKKNSRSEKEQKSVKKWVGLGLKKAEEWGGPPIEGRIPRQWRVGGQRKGKFQRNSRGKKGKENGDLGVKTGGKDIKPKNCRGR